MSHMHWLSTYCVPVTGVQQWTGPVKGPVLGTDLGRGGSHRLPRTTAAEKGDRLARGAGRGATALHWCAGGAAGGAGQADPSHVQRPWEGDTVGEVSRDQAMQGPWVRERWGALHVCGNSWRTFQALAGGGWPWEVEVWSRSSAGCALARPCPLWADQGGGLERAGQE